MRKYLFFFLVLSLASCSFDSTEIPPAFQTSSVEGDADDCAIWIHPSDRAKGLIIGNDKSARGGLYVWNLKGELLYKTPPLNRPSNLDIRYGMSFDHQSIDILACALRGTNTIKIFRIHADSPVLEDITSEDGIPTGFSENTYGLTLYQSPTDSSIYLFVSQKKNQADIHQFRLEDNGQRKIGGTFIHAFGGRDQLSFVEGMCVDDELGFLYCSDERHAVLKYHADPTQTKQLIRAFAQKDGISGDREGLALYRCPQQKGYLLLSSQGNSTLKVYERGGDNAFVTTIKKGGSVNTDGIDATSCAIPHLFNHGFVVCHHSQGKNFLVYDWEKFSKKKLLNCQCEHP